MTTALARYTSPAQLSVQEMMSIGDLFAQSGLFTDIRGAAQATTKIIAGQELGIPPFAAMNGFHIIKGKAAMGANLGAQPALNELDNDKLLSACYGAAGL